MAGNTGSPTRRVGLGERGVRDIRPSDGLRSRQGRRGLCFLAGWGFWPLGLTYGKMSNSFCKSLTASEGAVRLCDWGVYGSLGASNNLLIATDYVLS